MPYTVVEVCDATMLNSSTKVGTQKISMANFCIQCFGLVNHFLQAFNGGHFAT